MQGDRTGNQGRVTGAEHLSDAAQAMLAQIATGNFGDDTGTATAENAVSDSTSTDAEATDAEMDSDEPEDADTVSDDSEADEEVPEDLAALQQQYAAEVTRLMEQYQRAEREREQAQTDYRNAVAFGTRKSQDAAEASRTVETLTQRLAALEQQLVNTTKQASTDAESLGYDQEALSALGVTPNVLRSLLVQLPEYQQLAGTVMQMAQREQQRSYAEQIENQTKTLLSKVDGWSQELYGVPTSQLHDSSQRQVLSVALQLYGSGRMEDAERLIRAELGRVVAQRVTQRQERGQSAALKAVSEPARGAAPKTTKPRSGTNFDLELGEDFAKLSAPESSSRLQEAMLRAINGLPRKPA